MRAIVPILFVALSVLPPAREDEPRTLFGGTVDRWIRVLRDTTSREVDRRRAIGALAAFGPEAKAAAPELIEEIHRGPLRSEAVNALVEIGMGASETVPIAIDRFTKQGCVHLT